MRKCNSDGGASGQIHFRPTAERRATFISDGGALGHVQVHADKAARFIAGVLRLLNALERLRKIPLGDVAVEIDQHIATHRFAQPIDDRLIEPTARLAFKSDQQIATAAACLVRGSVPPLQIRIPSFPVEDRW